jgi:hypothetical protein
MKDKMETMVTCASYNTTMVSFIVDILSETSLACVPSKLAEIKHFTLNSI